MKERILYSMLGAVIATALVFTFVVQLVQMSFLSRQIESELERSVRQLGVAMDRDPDPLGYLQALADSGFEERITLIAADGSVLLDSRSEARKHIFSLFHHRYLTSQQADQSDP